MMQNKQLAVFACLLCLAHSDEHTWSLRHSEPSRDGRFLSVPIYYGDWVPISRAKQTIEAVASKIEAAHNKYRRVDPPPEIITADEPEDRLDVVQLSPHQNFVPYSPPSQHHQQQHHYHSGHHAGQRPRPAGGGGGRRRQDDLRATRGHRKLPPPAPYANQFFHHQQPTTPKPEETTSTSSGFNLGNVFNFLNPLIQHKPDIILHDSPVIKTLPAPDLTKAGPPVIELGGGYAEGAEDLYVERLEAKRRQEYQQQQKLHNERQNDQHLASFVDVDFEHFVPGHVEDIEPPRPANNRYRHPHQENNPGNFSVLVSGLSKNPNAKELAKLFKEGSVDESIHKAYITSNNVAAPEGFGKVTLPFLEPLEAAQKPLGSLPPVFIAPVGYKVPPGYKGHPLPYDPSIVDKIANREKVNLLTSTNSPNDVDQVRNPFISKYNTKRPVVDEPQQEVQPVVTEDHEEDSEDGNPTSLVLNKLKLARDRNRAQLASFYKNKEPTGAVAPITPLVTSDLVGKKRKRILTKIVRKPYNPETVTTSSSEKISDEDVHTVVRIINPNLSSEEEEIVEEITEATATTVLPQEQEEQVTVKPEVEEANTESFVTLPTEHFEPTTTIRYDHEAEPSDQVLFVTSPRPRQAPAVNFITKKPKVTTPEQVTTTAASVESTEDSGIYQPTPFSPLDPLKRLRFKAASKKNTLFGSLVDSSSEQDTGSEEATKKPYEVSSPLLKLRKYGFNQGTNNGAIYGQRIRIRQKPSFWANREETYEYYPPTTESTTSTEGDYKKKFRPFFDQLYEQLTGSTTTEVPALDETRKLLPYWASKTSKSRLTTTPNPFSIAAEIYEVYPPSQHSLETTDNYHYDDYQYEAEPRVDDVRNTQYVDDADYTTEHETADKHSTTEHVVAVDDTTDIPEAHEEDNYVEEPESGFVHSEVHLDFGESQHNEKTWNEVQPPPRGLDTYQKDFYPSQELADEHNSNYKEPVGIFNEHSQQKLTVKEGDFIPFHSDEENGGWQGVGSKQKIPYVEIQREAVNDEAPLQISIKHVPTDDNDLIKNVLEEVYNIPVEPELVEESEELATTPYLFITPTTRPDVTETTEVAETEVPPTTLVKEFEVEEAQQEVETGYTETTEAETAVTFEDSHFTTNIDEPEPTAEVGQESVDELEATTEEVQVTTFRPKGGFFDSLTNFINNLIPSRTTTTTTTTEAVEVETTTLEEAATTLAPRTSASTERLEPDHGIYESESSLSNEAEDNFEDLDLESTTAKYPVRLHRPKKYPPTARDDYLHLELVKSRNNVSSEDDITTTESTPADEVSKDVFGAIRREEYFKNWVARKYKKPEDGKAKFTLSDPTAFPALTKSTSASEEDVGATEAVTDSTGLLPFAPTVLPNHNFADYTRRKKKISFLEKLKTSARNSILKKEDEILKPRPSIPAVTTTTTTTTTTKKPILYPRGSNLNLFKTWAGNTLSQAEFEKTILGVSTATEVTVQSRICVRGQCFNADDKAAASSFLNR